MTAVLSLAKALPAAPAQIADAEADALVRTMGIPPRPATLLELQAEIDREEPDLQRVARLVASDVALAAAMLRIVNSPAYALRRPCDTLDQAVRMIGLKQIAQIVTGVLLRKSLRTDGPQLTRSGTSRASARSRSREWRPSSAAAPSTSTSRNRSASSATSASRC